MKTIKKWLSVIMAFVLLFAAYSAATPPLGPGLSQTATGQSVGTQTDVTLWAEEIAVTEFTPNPNASVKQNAVLQVVVNQPNIDHATIEIFFDEYTYLYGFKPVDITAQRANTMVDVTYTNNIGKITISITSSDAVTQDQKLLRFYFYGLDSTINPCTHITYTSQARKVDETLITNPFTYQIALMGNPQYDSAAGQSITNGTISADDALWVLQYTSNKHNEVCCPDLELRKLAADVNMDQAVTATDSQIILKWPTGKIKSFLDINRIFLPYGMSAGGVPCQMKNVQTNRYLQRSSNGSLCLWNSDTSSDGLFRFEKITSSAYCLYRIYSLYNNQKLCLVSQSESRARRVRTLHY